MTPKGADLAATDLIEVSTLEGGSYVTKSITGQELIDAIPAPSGFVPTSRTLTINGVAQDLSADRSWTIATGLTIGATPIASGTIGRVLFQGTGNVLQQSSSLFWDGTNNRLGIGTSSPTTIVHINGNAAGSEPSLQIRQQANTTPTWFAVRNTDNLAATGAVSLDLGISGGTGQFFTGTAQGDIVLKAYSNPSTSKFFLGTGNTAQMVLFPSTNNIGINTTTDAGFRLDVNGTARVQDLLDVAGTNGRLIFRAPELSTRLNGVHWVNPLNTGSYGYIALSGGTGEMRMFTSGSYFPTFYSNGSERMRIPTTGNVLINTTTDAGFRLDVNGTARVSGNTTVSLNQNAQTVLTVSNTTSGTNSSAFLTATSTNGSFSFGKNSAAYTPYKILLANDAVMYNATSGDISIFNDFATGQIKFAAGGSTTTYMTIKSNGRINMSALPTSSAGLSAGDIWNDGGTLKIV